MLESYVESANEVRTLLLQKDSIKKLININDNLVRELIEFLVPFRECSQILSGDTYPTIQLVALWYHDLSHHIKVKDSDSAEMRKLKQQAAHCYEEYLVVDDLHNVACILDPRYKSLQFADINSRARALTLLQQYIDEQQVEMSRLSPAATSATDNPKDVETSHRKSRFEKYMDDSNSQEMTELNRYLLHNFSDLGAKGENFDILKFWKRQDDFQKLKRVAHWVLATPASEASDERVFSDAGYVMTPRTTTLKAETLSETVFVHRNANLLPM